MAAVDLSLRLPGYSLVECLYTGAKTLVYRAVQAETADQASRLVVIKLLAQDYPSFNTLLQFRNQYIIAKNLKIEGVIRPYSLEPYGNSYALVMEDFGGISLRQYAQSRSLPLAETLAIALQIATVIDELGHHRVVHKDINTANILIQPESKQVKLTDFSIASLLPKETQTLQNPNILEGTLAYLAPEQTGRMNRGIDYRADFYSLGVTLYELLTGQLPFQSEDPLELVHCHIAQTPVPPHQINPQIPPVVSAIVLKLMAKNAEDRYQNALGLKHDLEKCSHQWQATGTVADFPLGQRDASDRFLIPEKLYGREAEVNALLAAFERVAAGTTELMLVAGFSGIGKTSVVHEIHKPITRQQGYFIKGKFDQFNRNLPLSAFVQALRQLMGQLLAESDARLAQWRTQILQVVGDNGQILIEVIPELARIIGPQPPVPELSGTAAQNRFNLLFQKFIAIFTVAEYPLVIFLDDLQWADLASLQFIKLLMQSRGHLLLLGAYRDNEVSPAHPFMLMLDELTSAGITVNTLTLPPLPLDRVNQLVADTLSCPPAVAQPLTELVHQKTQGNPFFTTQFLKGLHQDGYISFDYDLGAWQCDIAQVRSLAITDDVVEFMATQLQKLPPQTQSVLKLAACIGARFDLGTLAVISEQSQTETAAALWQALQAGLILPIAETYKFFQANEAETAQTEVSVPYKFLHDRVQQAAYRLIPAAQKQTTHYHIGQLLLQQIAPTAREERIFELVNQLNYGTTLLTQQSERNELAQLNFLACRKAKSATAYQAAREYASIGLALLGDKVWQQQYALSLKFHALAAEVASLCGDFEAMEQLVATVIAQAQSLLDPVEVYRIRIQAHIARHQLTEAIAIAQKLLQALGITLPEKPTPADIQQLIAEINALIGDRQIADLIDLPRMTDPHKIAIVQIASSILPAAFLSGSPLYPVLVALAVKLSIQHGHTLVSGYAYANYSVIACNLLKDIDTGVKFGQLALQIVSHLDARAVKPQVFVPIGLFIWHRKAPIKETRSLLQEGYAAALEVGNHDMAGHNAHGFCFNSFWCGQPLDALELETQTYCNGLMQINQLTTADYCRIYWQAIANLRGTSEQPSLLTGEIIQEAEFLPRLVATHNNYGLYCFYLYKVMLSYLFEDIAAAKNYATEVKRYAATGAGKVGEPAFYFYESLIILASLTPDSAAIASALAIVEQNQTHLYQQWAQPAPMNHQHKFDLVEAEKCRVLGDRVRAMDLYDQAIAGAKANEYLPEEALANELAAKFYQAGGKEKVAAGYMQEAYYGYALWGARAKTDDLEKRYPHLLQPVLQPSAPGSLEPLATIAAPSLSGSAAKSSRSSSNHINTALDFASILKASQALSSTIHLDELLGQLSQIILQNSGGDRCLLVLPHDDTWRLKAIATPDVTELCSDPLADSEPLPLKLIQYVKNTQEVVVIDALETDLPVLDETLCQQQPQSLLCLPLLNQGHLVGIVHLTHQSVSGVFTRDRILILNFLCTQAAISLENAQLYSQTQQALQDLQQTQLQLVQSEKMSALGNLVAGIAHEINNPVGFISGNLVELKQSWTDLTAHLALYQQAAPPEALARHADQIDLAYLLDDLPKMLESITKGCDRIRHISTSLRVFSRAEQGQKVGFSLHELIESTLLILKHRLKANEHRPAIAIVKNYGHLPDVPCYPGQLSQVFMNILANAIDALDESNQTKTYAEIEAQPNQITITTQVVGSQISVSIRDNGIGMTDTVKHQIFDYLYTTKAAGKGTGLGLAIAHQIMTEKHNGAIAVQSVPNQGTEFVLTLPIHSSTPSNT